MPERADLIHRFQFHPANTDDLKARHGRVRLEVGLLAAFLNDTLPESREKALAITKLEEAMFWANAAVARDGAK